MLRDVVEIQTLRKMFESKYGKEYVIEATNDATCSKWQVTIPCMSVIPRFMMLLIQLMMFYISLPLSSLL